MLIQVVLRLNRLVSKQFVVCDCISEWNGSKPHEHDSGIENSRNYSTTPTTNSTDKERPSTPNQMMSNPEKFEAKKSIFILIGIFSISLAAMFYVYMMFPKLEE